MNSVNEQAALRGIETAYQDAFGHPHVVSAEVLARLVESIPLDAAAHERMLAPTVVARRGHELWLTLSTFCGASGSIRWGIFAPEKIVAGEAAASPIRLPSDLTVGTYDLQVCMTTPQGERRESATLLVAPAETYQGDDPSRRQWALAVQLYAIRSRRNWGHGDFHRPLGLDRLGKRTRCRRRRTQPAPPLFRGEPLFAQQSAVSQSALHRSRRCSGVRRVEDSRDAGDHRTAAASGFGRLRWRPHGEMAGSREGLRGVLHIVKSRAAEQPRTLS